MSNHMDFFQFYSPYHCIIIRATVEHHNVKYLAPVNIRTRYKRTSVHLIPKSFVWIGVKRDLLLVCTLVLEVKRVWLLCLDGIKRMVKGPYSSLGIFWMFFSLFLSHVQHKVFQSLSLTKIILSERQEIADDVFWKTIYNMYRFMWWRLQRQNLFVSKYSVSLSNAAKKTCQPAPWNSSYFLKLFLHVLVVH